MWDPGHLRFPSRPRSAQVRPVLFGGQDHPVEFRSYSSPRAKISCRNKSSLGEWASLAVFCYRCFRTNPFGLHISCCAGPYHFSKQLFLPT